LTLPFLNRNQGEVQALRASARQAALQRAAVERSIRAEIGSAVATYESATSEVRILATTVLGPARQNRNLVEIAYREGKVGLAELLLIQNQAIDAELDYWNAWLAAREALADLTQATAQNIEELEEPNLGTNR
jgi:cobalt-zinc-cadmium efflux system outer membrane protein